MAHLPRQQAQRATVQAAASLSQRLQRGMCLAAVGRPAVREYRSGQEGAWVRLLEAVPTASGLTYCQTAALHSFM